MNPLLAVSATHSGRRAHRAHASTDRDYQGLGGDYFARRNGAEGRAGERTRPHSPDSMPPNDTLLRGFLPAVAQARRRALAARSPA